MLSCRYIYRTHFGFDHFAPMFFLSFCICSHIVQHSATQTYTQRHTHTHARANQTKQKETLSSDTTPRPPPPSLKTKQNKQEPTIKAHLSLKARGSEQRSSTGERTQETGHTSEALNVYKSGAVTKSGSEGERVREEVWNPSGEVPRRRGYNPHPVMNHALRSPGCHSLGDLWRLC